MKTAGKYLKVAVFTVFLSLVIGGLVLLALGTNPFRTYYNFLQGCGMAPKGKYGGGKSMLTDLSSFVDYLTPMLFAALACAVAFGTGLFNIGISGQMLAAGYVATVLVGYSDLPGVAARPLVVLIGMLTGMAVGALIGFLKYRFNINEVVSSIMLNYIIRYIVSFLIQTRHVDPVSRQSVTIHDSARLTLSGIVIGGYKYDLPIGFVLAVAAMLLVGFVRYRTDIGFARGATGLNITAAKYAGINVRFAVIMSMGISGLLAGLAGVTYYMGYLGSIQPGTLADTGFDAIAVCLLGNGDPIGIFLASVIIEIIDKGSIYMSSQTGMESEIASVITGLILLFSACNAFFMNRAEQRKQEKQKKTVEKTENILKAETKGEGAENGCNQ